VIAETDDDLSTLPLPAEESAPSPSPKDDIKSDVDATPSSESQAKAPPSPKSKETATAIPSENPSPHRPSSESQKQTYPLYPSIVQLFHEKNIPTSEADKIPASGPKGRLLKGDVLAYLGRISSSYSSDQSARISKLGHLDLSTAKPAPRKETPPQPQSHAQAQEVPEVDPIDTKVAIPVSLSSVLSVQKRIQATLGVTLPLSTFVARAAELANDDLPRSATAKPTADELFNDILGLNDVRLGASKGGYIPQITAFPIQPIAERLTPQRDVYDILTGTASPRPRKAVGMPSPDTAAVLNAGDATKVFSVSASKGEEKRARVFLERVKTILQVEPGRLIL